ncbi:MAG: methylmalonyl Co-A mutase-associated GTPase MeaB, partial [Rhodospirillales bacterium]|nr:methylmalonyl Co-A mutase-associated GTPase MeaB [Rhodospirillales bacterium]
KSTFIESFGQHAIDQGHKVAVLAIDPSSPKSGGSILGDKTRMEILSRHKNAFIRPSPSSGMLGGIARKTYDTMLLCEAAGFDVVIIETVGVGQSETTASDLVDMFLVLLAPGGGDDLQGIKRGIMELADMLVINKADGDLAAAAERARHDQAAAVSIMRPNSEYWATPVMTCSAIKGQGITEIWDKTEQFRSTVTNNGILETRRSLQARSLMKSEVVETVLHEFRSNPELSHIWQEIEEEVANGERSPSDGACQLLEKLRKI